MNGLIRASLRNPYAVTVFCLTLVLLGTVSVYLIPIDILPVFKSPAVQVLTFYSGMPAASIEKDITNRMERWVGQANGTSRQESRSIVGASIVRDYFRSGVDPNGALTQVNSLALALMPELLDQADLPGWATSIATARGELTELVSAYGLRPRPSAANFILVDGAGGLRERLAARGVLVRDCTSFGLPDAVRIAVPAPAGLRRLSVALEEALA